MKKIALIFVMMLATFSYAQVTLTQEQINKLSPEVQSALKAANTEQQITTQIETVSKYAGMGKEIGTAVNESLKAVSSTVVDLSETKVGKITMALVVYKVIGTDILQLFIGILWITIILIVSWKIYRNNCERTMLKSKIWNKEGKGWEVEYIKVEEEVDYKNTAITIFCIGLIAALPIFLV